MVRGVETFHIKQYEEHRVSTIIGGGEFTKNREYLLEFEGKFKKPSHTE
jgi:hypothetical protein